LIRKPLNNVVPLDNLNADFGHSLTEEEIVDCAAYEELRKHLSEEHVDAHVQRESDARTTVELRLKRARDLLPKYRAFVEGMMRRPAATESGSNTAS
jgi:hypothetical protein